MVIVNLHVGRSPNRFIIVRNSPSQDFYREAAQKIQNTHIKTVRSPSRIFSSELCEFFQKSNFVEYLNLNVAYFFYKNTFISNARLKLAKNQANAKQHPEAEPLLFENYSLSSSTSPSKNNRRYFKKCAKNKYVCLK